MAEQIVFIFLSILFVIGGIGIAIIAKKQEKKERKKAWVKYVVYLGIIYLLFGAICFCPMFFNILCGIISLGGIVELFRLQYTKYKRPYRWFFLWTAIYITICIAFFQFGFLNKKILLFTLLTVCSFDAFSQLSGQLLGKRKLFPNISPNKTFEGLIGGTFLSLLVSLIVGKIMDWSMFYAVFLGLGIIISSFIGDLLASYVKRQYKVKDFSTVFPGHGGFLDRFDSFILAGAFVYIVQLSQGNWQLFCAVIFIISYLLFVGFCEFLTRKRNISSEYTRKTTHVITSISALTFPYIFPDYRYAIGLCVFCFFIFLIANLTKLFHSIDGVGRRTGGSYLLALSVGITYYLYVLYQDIAIYSLSILIIAICDPLAGILGKHIKSKQLINNKSIVGSLAFLLSAFAISMIYLHVNGYIHDFRTSVFIAFAAMLVELFSPRGTDNITIPLTVSGILIMVY